MIQADRLNAIHASMRGNKNVLSQLPCAQALAVPLLLLEPSCAEHPAGLGQGNATAVYRASRTCPVRAKPLYFSPCQMSAPSNVIARRTSVNTPDQHRR